MVLVHLCIFSLVPIVIFVTFVDIHIIPSALRLYSIRSVEQAGAPSLAFGFGFGFGFGFWSRLGLGLGFGLGFGTSG